MLQITTERESGRDPTAPKHGKADARNQPHVGGNTWAGGTGGTSTAGLGGKGGPYRLDAGHDVSQVSRRCPPAISGCRLQLISVSHKVPDWEKEAVPEHVTKAAREMAQKAFQQRYLLN